MKSQELKIEGMSCGHCVMSVRKELSKLVGLAVEDVQIGQAKVRYDESKLTEDAISAAIDAAGYRLINE